MLSREESKYLRWFLGCIWMFLGIISLFHSAHLEVEMEYMCMYVRHHFKDDQ